MNRWVLGSRPRTLPAAVVPVAVGTALCVGQGGAQWWRAVVALVVSVALQIGVNFANDYSDGVRGTDDVRVGPQRLVASGLAEPQAVKCAAFVSFGGAAIAGLVLAIVTTPWLILVGVAAIAAGWFYTGGPNPYGYLGLGEVFVFVFFGLVATVGTAFVIIERFPADSWIAGCAIGCWACALLVVNNLRDIPTDSVSGKRTLAVRLGDRYTRLFYGVLIVAALVLGAILAARTLWCLLVIFTIPFTIRPLRSVTSGAEGRALIPVLEATGRSQLMFGVLLCAGLAIGG
ncbi:MAG: 1,4-dihydroxy-2-naphthoate polyprenyltransferase [Actinomycetota bacterium]